MFNMYNSQRLGQLIAYYRSRSKLLKVCRNFLAALTWTVLWLSVRQILYP